MRCGSAAHAHSLTDVDQFQIRPPVPTLVKRGRVTEIRLLARRFCGAYLRGVRTRASQHMLYMILGA